ncbi:MAG TPA: bifunctional 4-hydroxy-2-oxoglutarate aldolase/2-dehydro-3-deoxy-phosphogluconate aldolase [Armatimonadota bacterium]|jgi:2-dehydro-3-deoxyphosphogluconate aldolase/(4S)-4-hydroxy-2-oxoglutarate aldolase
MHGSFDWEAFRAVPIVGILRHFSAATVCELALAAAQGGLTTLEITMNTPDAPAVIRQARAVAGHLLNIGAGTVCTLDDFTHARQAGAEFIVTPVLVPEVIQACRAEGVPIFPGAFTPTEIYQAWALGAAMVKVFPAQQLGPAYIRDLKGPLPQIPLLPTGGVTLDTLADFVRAGAEGFGIGSPLFDPAYCAAGDWEAITARTRQFVATYQQAGDV